jgi:hypothetical protein
MLQPFLVLRDIHNLILCFPVQMLTFCNFFCREIEEFLHTHPEIQEAQVNDFLSTEKKKFVVLLDENDIPVFLFF